MTGHLQRREFSIFFSFKCFTQRVYVSSVWNGVLFVSKVLSLHDRCSWNKTKAIDREAAQDRVPIIGWDIILNNKDDILVRACVVFDIMISDYKYCYYRFYIISNGEPAGIVSKSNGSKRFVLETI